MDAGFFVFADVDAVGESLVGEAFALLVASGVEVGAVDQEPERCRDLFAGAFDLIVFVFDASVDVGEPDAYAVSVPFQSFQVDCVGEVGGEQLVTCVL